MGCHQLDCSVAAEDDCSVDFWRNDALPIGFPSRDVLYAVAGALKNAAQFATLRFSAKSIRIMDEGYFHVRRREANAVGVMGCKISSLGMTSNIVASAYLNRFPMHLRIGEPCDIFVSRLLDQTGCRPYCEDTVSSLLVRRLEYAHPYFK
jgi:hypothetical protein